MQRSIADLISDFSSPAAPEGLGIGILRPARQVQERAQEPEPSQSAADRQAELIKSVENRVRAEERAVAREHLEKAIAAEKDRHREELIAQRVIWIEQEAQQLSAQLVSAITGLESRLSERAARILASVIPEALRQNAIREFNEALRTVLSGGASTLLKVTGPEDLLRAIKAGVSLPDNAIEFEPSTNVEVTLVAGDTMIQTQFSTWSERLQALLRTDSSC